MKERDAYCVLKGGTSSTIHQYTTCRNYSVRNVHLIVRIVHINLINFVLNLPLLLY